MESQDKKEVKKWIREVWIMWAVFLCTLFIYIGLCYLKKNDVPYFAEAKLPLEIIKYSFFIFALGSLCFTYSYRERWLKNQIIKINQRIIQRAHKINTPPIFLKYSTDVISSFAFSLCSGFLGLTYFFLSGDWQAFYVFIAISAIAITYFRPKLKEFEQYLSKNIDHTERVRGDSVMEKTE